MQSAAQQWEDFDRATVSPVLPAAQRDGLQRAYYAGFLAGMESAAKAKGKKGFYAAIVTLIAELDEIMARRS